MIQKNKNYMMKQADIKLWRYAMKDVLPLKTSNHHSILPSLPYSPDLKKISRMPIIQKVSAPVKPVRLLHKNDIRPLMRQRKSLDASLDLHGFTADMAYKKLSQFIYIAHDRGYKWILVITGKGLNNQGILRKKMPHWLCGDVLSPFVSGYSPAPMKQGGMGAFYVCLRKKL